MPVLLQYRKSDGVITGHWEANLLSLVEAQSVPDDPTYGYGLDTTGEPWERLVTGYYFVGAVLTPTTVLRLVADANPFPADGTTVCSVSVFPFVACTVLVDGTPVALTPSDTSVELTSDVPHTFVLAIAPMAGYQSVPLHVLAEGP